MSAPFDTFAKQLEAQFGLQSNPSPAQLDLIAEQLRQLCAQVQFDTQQFPEAMPGQEVLHELALSASGGPSIYLVSDGGGVVSPPHGHQTWAGIVGVRGCELNTLFQRSSNQNGLLEQTESVNVRAGQVLTLANDEIHSTEAIGPQGDATTGHPSNSNKICVPF